MVIKMLTDLGEEQMNTEELQQGDRKYKNAPKRSHRPNNTITEPMNAQGEFNSRRDGEKNQ